LRREIPPASSFARDSSLKLTPPEVCSEVRKLFAGYEWPGNVRELQNVIQHAVLMAKSKSIGLCDLPEYMQTGSRAELLFLEVRDKEAENVEKDFLLKRHYGNISKAAALAQDDPSARQEVQLRSRRFR
jgi:transcriptional regulator of acetoin/glycerol metabolism